MLHLQNLFTEARKIPSAEVARKAGVALKRRGGHEWGCCPFHQENTPSLCFYQDGGWYCFGCHRGGTSVDFFAQFYGVSPFEAAKELTGDNNLPRTVQHHEAPTHKQEFLERPDEDGFTWGELCAILHRSQAVIESENADTPRLWEALAARSEAEIRLDNMLAAEFDAQTDHAIKGKEGLKDEQRNGYSA